MLSFFLLLFFLEWTLSESASKCNEATDLCVHVENCRKYSKRYLNKEHWTNPHFMQELRDLRCKNKKAHICCPKQEIGCVFEGEQGVCLLQNQCPKLLATPEAELLKKHYCGMSNEKNYFCCTDPYCVLHKQLCEQPEAPILRRPPLVFPDCSSGGKPGTSVPSKLCDSTLPEQSGKVCCLNEEPDRTMLHHKAAGLARMPCGTTITEDNKIFNGTHALEGEFPWMARLVYRKKGVCSGTLIHPSYVLTARHCANVNLIAVRLGLRDLGEGRKNSLQMQEINVAEKIPYNLYDVALLRLSQPAVIEESMVRPICLPLFANLRMNVPKKLTIAGWGLTETGRPSDILMKAQSSVLNSSSSVKGCTKAHEICIGGENAHSHHCGGDSGGPYQALDVFNGSMRFVQFGVISHGGQFCSTQNVPGKGVLVGYVLDWVLDNMIL
uniref:Peptidase S1 domain-containing protein n=1 Tax=Anopheles atroparvus TaxID=41427 RepID=A0AAG5CSA5_ANOAO